MVIPHDLLCNIFSHSFLFLCLLPTGPFFRSICFVMQRGLVFLNFFWLVVMRSEWKSCQGKGMDFLFFY